MPQYHSCSSESACLPEGRLLGAVLFPGTVPRLPRLKHMIPRNPFWSSPCSLGSHPELTVVPWGWVPCSPSSEEGPGPDPDRQLKWQLMGALVGRRCLDSTVEPAPVFLHLAKVTAILALSELGLARPVEGTNHPVLQPAIPSLHPASFWGGSEKGEGGML